jgi:hypothetical protein
MTDSTNKAIKMATEAGFVLQKLQGLLAGYFYVRFTSFAAV